ncbi:phosphoesterase [Microbacterium phage Tempo]|nr:phosphoesterase [Microbacterium phage Tempo]QKO02781.1 phosphoesterase [Microbacterium phage Kelcole]UOW92774.1 phosphoesterase [Microbacterium phage RobinRose]WNT44241.1 phosphoesterase [Microbacterium phage CandC]
MVAADLIAPPVAQADQGTASTVSWVGLGVQTGDVLVWAVRSQGTINADITLPAGWFRGGVEGAIGVGDRFQGIFYHLVTNAATDPLSYTFTGLSTASSRLTAGKAVLRGADPAHLNDGGLLYRNDNFMPAFNVGAAPYTVFGLWGAEFTAGNSPVPTAIPADFAIRLNAQGTGTAIVDNSVTTSSRTGILLIEKKVEAGGSVAVPALTPTWPGAPTSLKSVTWAVRGLTAAPSIGIPVELGDGTGAKLTFIDTDGVQKTPSALEVWQAGFATPAALLAVPGATMAHRGGSLSWPEYSEIAYDRSVLEGYGALEFSCSFSLDNVPFGNGDQYLDRIAGVTGNVDPTTLTWAQISATYRNVLRPVASGVTQPLYRLVDFLAKFARHHTVLVDPKFGFNNTTRLNTMLDICEASGHKDRIVIKFDSPLASNAMVDAAKAREFLTMNYWGTEIEKLTTGYGTDRWDWIGVRYDADQAMYDAAIAIGKPVWAAVIPDQAGYNLAMSRGADMAMISGVAAVTPVR